MTQNSLKIITINELAPGMFVHKIIEQSGGLLLKSQGKVSSQNMVVSLKQKGVKRLVIDLSKQFVPDTPATTIAHQTQPESKSRVSFNQEMPRAEKLHAQGKAIQKMLLASVSKGLPFDENIPREFSHKLVESMERNPDALLCLSKIREKDDYLLEHSLNVAIILANFGQFIGMGEKEVSDLAYAGFLHDMGKIRVPDEVLHKPGRLTDAEMDIMKQHVAYGVEALKAVNIEQALIRVVSEHHERLDGKGYPAGIKGSQISFAGRMLAIADMYDALTADRCYKAGMPSQKALKILLDETPDRLDRQLVMQFIKCMGVYPVGSLVKLSNGKLAMVLKQNTSPIEPLVKVFYSLQGNHFLEPKDLDIQKTSQVKVECAVLASDYNIDFNSFFERSIIV